LASGAAGDGQLWTSKGLTAHDMTNKHHPYELEVRAAARKPGMFEWNIRKHGKLSERSDKLYRSEADALKDGEKAIERQFAEAQSTR